MHFSSLLLALFLCGCSFLAEEGILLGETLISDLTKKEKEQLNRLSDKEKEELVALLEKKTKSPDRTNTQHAHIVVHQYYLAKNHLSKEEESEVKKRIEKWQN